MDRNCCAGMKNDCPNKLHCTGFPKGPCAGVPNRNPYWCDECDDKRLDHITEQMEGLGKKY